MNDDDYNLNLATYLIKSLKLGCKIQELCDTITTFNSSQSDLGDVDEKHEKKDDQLHTCDYIPSKGRYKGVRCDRKATHEIGGRWYCGTAFVEDDKTVYKGHARSAELALSSQKRASVPPQNTLIQRRNVKDNKSQSMVERILEQKNEFFVKINKWGNKWNEETRLVFHPATNVVLGKQRDNGTLSPLQESDVKLCERHNWTFDHHNLADHLKSRVVEEIREKSNDEEEYILE